MNQQTVEERYDSIIRLREQLLNLHSHENKTFMFARTGQILEEMIPNAPSKQRLIDQLLEREFDTSLKFKLRVSLTLLRWIEWEKAGEKRCFDCLDEVILSCQRCFANACFRHLFSDHRLCDRCATQIIVDANMSVERSVMPNRPKRRNPRTETY
jgi:hypothetical protein